MRSLEEIQKTEVFKRAILDGATHYSTFTGSFYRPGRNSLEVAKVDDSNKLGEWEQDWHSHPPEHTERL